MDPIQPYTPELAKKIGEFQTMLFRLSRVGLQDFLLFSSKVAMQPQTVKKLTREQLLNVILVAEFGRANMETYNHANM